MTPIILDLTAVTYGGQALGRHEGKVIFVPYGIAGEKVLVEIVQDKGKFAEARLLEVLEPASTRIPPRCIHFGVCGGCHWQHMDYPAQLEFKQQIVRDQLARLGGLREVEVLPTIGSPFPWNYRTHVTFHFTEQGQPGYVSIDNHTVIPIQECHILRPELLQQLGHLQGKPGTRLRVQVDSSGAQVIIAPLNPLFNLPEDETSAASSEKITYEMMGRTFQATAGSFFQVNLAQAEKLVELVLEQVRLTGQERVLDLYAGVGLFAAFLAGQARQVTLLEFAPGAIADARTNLREFANVEYLQGAAETLLPAQKRRFEVVIADPPRAGIKPKALEAIIRSQPRQMIYVSCDPSTLARDAKQLVAHGYHLRQVQPVDMFPQTYHIECVATFEKR